MITPVAPNQHWFINSVTGWDRTTLVDMAASADGSLALNGLPGVASEYSPSISGDICCAGAVALGECNQPLILDTVCCRVARFEPTTRVTPIMAFGGKGNQRRQFNAPRGLAVRPGAMLVSDTGNHRVQVFSPSPYALLQVWGRDDGKSGSGNKEFNTPWGISIDGCGCAIVADRGNRRLQKIAMNGRWLANLGEGVLKDPTEVAAGPNGVVAVVDGAASAQGGRVLIFPSAPASPQIISGLSVAADPADANNFTINLLTDLTAPTPSQGTPPTILPLRACAVAFDNAGLLYVVATSGVIHRFDPSSTLPGQYTFVGAGATELTAPVNMVWRSDPALLVIAPDNTTGLRKLFSVPIGTSFVPEGSLLSEVLDGGVEDCVWDRIALDATLPRGTSIQVDYFTSAVSASDITNSFSTNSYTFTSTEVDTTAQATPTAPTYRDLTCLVVASPGRYLQFRLTFRSNSLTTPRLNSISIYFPRDSYLQYLPAVFQQDPIARDFLDRFLAIFKATFDSFDDKIDGMTALLDPMSVPEKYFPWLAGWINFQADTNWSLAKRRKMLKKAASTYRTKGTVAGLKQAVKDSLEDLADPRFSDQANEVDRKTTEISVIEHFKLRKWPILKATSFIGDIGDGQARLWSREFYQRLQVGTFSQVGGFLLTDTPIPAAESPEWGAHEFTVFFTTHPLRAACAAPKLAALVEREKPAHTKANIVPVLPRFRIGVQSALGVNSSVGVCTPLVLGVVSRLGYDAILATNPQQRDLEKLGTSPWPRIGIDTKLF
jgi:phage tail-like protein